MPAAVAAGNVLSVKSAALIAVFVGASAACAAEPVVNIPADYNPASQDGLRVHVETDGYSRFIYLPYTVSKSGFLDRKTVAAYRKPVSVGIAPQIFPPCRPGE